MTAVESVQELLDAGFNTSEIATQLNTYRQKIDRIIKNHQLEIYVAFDEHVPKQQILWTFYEDFRVVKSNQGVGYVDKLEAMRDAISEFVRTFDPDEITSKLLKRYRHIESYVYKLHNTLENFYSFYGLCGDFISYTRESKLGMYARLGHEFDRLVGEIFSYLSYECLSQVSVGDSRPDYIINNRWYDAKLSRSTAFNRSCQTIKKYRKHTDHLTIIYALDDTATDDPRVDFVYIAEYKPYVSDELGRKIDAFIRKASEVKYGCK